MAKIKNSATGRVVIGDWDVNNCRKTGRFQFRCDNGSYMWWIHETNDAFDAWESHWKRLGRGNIPRSNNHGWYFPTEFPPEPRLATKAHVDWMRDIENASL